MNYIGKKWIISQLAVLLIFPAFCSADYIIHLRDGRRFTTSVYREEGDQIRFERYGGFVGLPLEEVAQIQEVVVQEKKVPEVRKTEQKDESPQLKQVSAQPKNTKKNQTHPEDTQIALMEEKQRIVAEMRSASEAFKAAKAEQNRAKKDAAWQELFAVREKLRDLRETVSAMNGGELPTWWDQIQ